MNVLLLQLDGKLPNLALMRIAAYHRGRGDTVELRQYRRANRDSVRRSLWDSWDAVYASLIFERTRPVGQQVLHEYPQAKIGGTGWDEKVTLEGAGIPKVRPDYSDYPAFTASMGFTQRGCRLKCPFCKVPVAEGPVSFDGTVADLWRGDPWPRHLLLLDNDFFGQRDWPKRIEEIRGGGFRVCFTQGFNVRLIGEEEAAAIASVPYYASDFRTRRLYTAWDNRKDESRLFRNLEALVRHGVKPDDIEVYMLIGYWDGPRLQADDFYRHARLREFGCLPFPMPFVRTRELVGFQRWVVRRADLMVSWGEFERAGYRPERIGMVAAPARSVPVE